MARQKGTPNRKTQDLFEIANRLKCDPFEVLIMFTKADWKGLGYSSATITKVLKDGGTLEVERIPPELRLHAAKESAKYLYPQRKAVEHSSDEDKGFRILIQDYTVKK